MMQFENMLWAGFCDASRRAQGLLRRWVQRLLALGGLWGLWAAPAHALPSFDEVRAEHRSSDTLVLSREGEVLQRVRTDASVRRGGWVPLADVSPAMRWALVLSEDKRFYEHSGVDWQAVTAAAWGHVWHSRTRGASTLTMQLAGLLDGDWRQGPGGRTVPQKLGQAVAAQVLDRRWRKDQILEAYLNLVPFRGELVGIEALSRALFGKAPHGLDAREAAVAVALVRAPNAAAAQVSRRACGVWLQLQGGSRNPSDCDGLDLFVSATLQKRVFEAQAGVAPHWARQVLKTLPQQGLGVGAVRTTVSAPLQRHAAEMLRQQLRELRGRHVEDGAVVVLDNASGEVLAWVGSSAELSRASEVDGVLAARQAGSTLKPFLYAQALAERRLTAASLIEDSAAHIPTASGLYIPQNYDRRFKGWVSVRTALASSLNVPAVRALVMVSPEAFFRQLQLAGLALREGGDYFGYSLALGSPEVPLLALTNAYRTLANGGRAGEVAPYVPEARTPAGRARGAPVASTPVIDPRAAWVVGDILSDPQARAPTFGVDSVLATRFWSAVKTGTSKDMRDNWAVGWSSRYTVGVWVGNASGAPMHDVSGTSGAAPVWASVMQFLHRQQRSTQPPAPTGLVRQSVRFGVPAGQWAEAPRSEWFLSGTEQAMMAVDATAAPSSGLEVAPVLVAKNHSGALTSGQKGAKSSEEPVTDTVAAHIVEPVSGTILAIDPDIPPQRQRLTLLAEGVVQRPQDVRWWLDGQPIGQGLRLTWMPWPGRHRLQLVSLSGRVLDEVRLEVRGAGVKAGAWPAGKPLAAPGAGAGRGFVHPRSDSRV